MVCEACVRKLQDRLIKRYHLSTEKAYKLAYSAIQRVELRKRKDLLDGIIANLMSLDLFPRVKKEEKAFRLTIDNLTKDQIDKLIHKTRKVFRVFRTGEFVTILAVYPGILLEGRTNILWKKRRRVLKKGRYFHIRDIYNKTYNRIEETLLPKDIDPDYSQSCQKAGSCYCSSSLFTCRFDFQCVVNECSYSCPDPSDPNSSLVGNDCSVGNNYNCACGANGYCIDNRTCTCTVSGNCYYKCNEGYYWDGSQCVPLISRVLSFIQKVKRKFSHKIEIRRTSVPEFSVITSDIDTEILGGGYPANAVFPHNKRAWVYGGYWIVFFTAANKKVKYAVTYDQENWSIYDTPLPISDGGYVSSWLHGNTFEVCGNSIYVQGTFSVNKGSIDWNSCSTFATSGLARFGKICSTPDGYIWIAYRDGNPPATFKVDTTEYKDGSSWSSRSGFPKSLDTATYTGIASVLVEPASENGVYVFEVCSELTTNDYIDQTISLVTGRYVDPNTIGPKETIAKIWEHPSCNSAIDPGNTIWFVSYQGASRGSLYCRAPGTNSTWVFKGTVNNGYILQPGFAIPNSSIGYMFWLEGWSVDNELGWYETIDLINGSLNPAMPIHDGHNFFWREYFLTCSQNHPYEVFGVGAAKDQEGNTRLIANIIAWKRFIKKERPITFAIRKIKSAIQTVSFLLKNLAERIISTLHVEEDYILSVDVNPTVVIRETSEYVQLRADWSASGDKPASSFSCKFYVRDENNTVYGPYSGTVVKEGYNKYYATYNLDPDNSFLLGKYDVKAEVDFLG